MVSIYFLDSEAMSNQMGVAYKVGLLLDGDVSQLQAFYTLYQLTDAT